MADIPIYQRSNLPPATGPNALAPMSLADHSGMVNFGNTLTQFSGGILDKIVQSQIDTDKSNAIVAIDKIRAQSELYLDQNPDKAMGELQNKTNFNSTWSDATRDQLKSSIKTPDGQRYFDQAFNESKAQQLIHYQNRAMVVVAGQQEAQFKANISTLLEAPVNETYNERIIRLGNIKKVMVAAATNKIGYMYQPEVYDQQWHEAVYRTLAPAIIAEAAGVGVTNPDQVGKLIDQRIKELPDKVALLDKSKISGGHWEGDTFVPSAYNQSQQQNPQSMDQYNTPLTPEEESKFQDWKQKNAPNDSGFDYDLRGAFKAGVQPDQKTGHWPDTYKKPNHPTFSDQSQYSQKGFAFTADEVEKIKQHANTAIITARKQSEDNFGVLVSDSATKMNELRQKHDYAGMQAVIDSFPVKDVPNYLQNKLGVQMEMWQAWIRRLENGDKNISDPQTKIDAYNALDDLRHGKISQQDFFNKVSGTNAKLSPQDYERLMISGHREISDINTKFVNSSVEWLKKDSDYYKADPDLYRFGLEDWLTKHPDASEKDKYRAKMELAVTYDTMPKEETDARKKGEEPTHATPKTLKDYNRLSSGSLYLDPATGKIFRKK